MYKYGIIVLSSPEHAQETHCQKSRFVNDGVAGYLYLSGLSFSYLKLKIIETNSGCISPPTLIPADNFLYSYHLNV